MKSSSLVALVSLAVTMTCLLSNCASVTAYKPIFFLHGLGSDAAAFDKMIALIQKQHPGTAVYPLAMFERVNSYASLPLQLSDIASNITAIISSAKPAVFADGYHFVCHSQGGLLCRCLTEYFAHDVDTLVSLAGPQMGVYDPHYFSFFPAAWANLTEEDIYAVAYVPAIQDTLSIANMWHDPHHQSDFLKGNAFLPLYNALDAKPAPELKQNFLRLQKAVFLVGNMESVPGYGEYDGGVGPWVSGNWGFYNETTMKAVAEQARREVEAEEEALKNDANDDDDDESPSSLVRPSTRIERYHCRVRTLLRSPAVRATLFTPMQEQPIYIDDTFGLRTLDEQGRLVVTEVDKVEHGEWLDNENIMMTYVLPHLI